MSLREIRKIASKVRRAFEIIEKDEGGYGDSEIGDLGGYCGRASVQMYLLCKQYGIVLKLVEGEGHLFNMYKDYIIDITATQFGLSQRIYIKNVKFVKKLPDYHTPIRYHHSAKTAETVYGVRTDTVRDRRVIHKVMGKDV